ncbi:hypothetical protein [Methylobacterium oryzihabitans]|uniref:HNH endonuclease n=1 Tax=Methylobacterium oryzihabitans TaxID=2499852 RepID=A0A3S2V4D0_9HYPH|nr:hypothetical protein [Methylobacterium oryzihabitans]RVU13194.1 hypothetical protein EOE48_26855 [Methylobacterium oryzihabitans]
MSEAAIGNMFKRPKFDYPKCCVFCGSTSTTKEHIFPRWLERELGGMRSITPHRISRVTRSEDGYNILSRPSAGRLDRNNEMQKQLRIACNECNNGWMSRLQEAAKPTIVYLLRRMRSTGPFTATHYLTQQQCHDLSKWAVMTSMVIEYADIPTVAVSQDHRNYFRETQNIPESWHVFAAGYRGVSTLSFWHIGIKNLIYPEIRGLAMCDLQICSFDVGPLYLQVCSVSSHNAALAEVLAGQGVRLSQLWPIVVPVAGINTLYNDVDLRRISSDIAAPISGFPPDYYDYKNPYDANGRLRGWSGAPDVN